MSPWHPSKRIAFRLLSLYFVFYASSWAAPLLAIPFIGPWLMMELGAAWEALALWTGHRVLGIEGEIFTGPTGSGDTTISYIHLLSMAVLAVVGCVIWTVLDRRRMSYPRLAALLVIACRYYLGIAMLAYGIGKVFKGQFPFPSLSTLLATYGDSSPMRLAWTFMGYSTPYTIFAGAAEVLGGLFLLFRRTRLLGATVSAGVMTNVVMINFSYDVPVKLFSAHLLLMAVCLLALDTRRLLNLFVLNRPASTADLSSPVPGRTLNVIGHVVKLSLLVYFCVASMIQSFDSYFTFGDGREKPPLYGIHDVSEFIAKGEALPPLRTDALRWDALVVDRPLPVFGRRGEIRILQMNGSLTNHEVELDTEARTISFYGEGPDSSITDILHYERPEPDTLVVRGSWQGHEIEVRMTERDLNAMELVGRGFHWINELPYQRPPR